MLDIDFFKKINDNYGHNIGDYVLLEFAQLIGSHLRNADVFGRWGGEEFIIICPYTNAASALALAERLCKVTGNFNIKGVGSITFSAGISQLRNNEKPKEMIIRADNSLYHSKKNGRNRVSIAG